MERGERATFFMTEVQLLIKSLSSAVFYIQSHDHEAHLRALTAALVTKKGVCE